jgi:putative PIN family toxin of toxin-antitoxin system
VAEVLVRPKIAKKYRIGSDDRHAFLELLRAEAILLPHAPAPAICRDPDDDYLLGCAASGGADYLVTGDDDLLAVRQHKDVAIVDARTFLAVLSAQEG